MKNDSHLSHWRRVTYAFALMVLVCGVAIMATAFVAPDFMEALLTGHYWVAVFAVSYLVAPRLNRYVKEK